MRNEAAGREPARSEERRKERRQTLVFRIGVLEQQAKSSLCVVRNISSTGVQFRFYTPPIVDAPASLRVADELPVAGRILWIKGDNGGMNFDEALDTTALLRVQQKLGPGRRRSTPRVAIEASATLRTGGRTYRASVHDISSLGARVRTSSALNPGDRAIVTFPDLPWFNAYVRWSDGEESGLTFETPIPMAIIAKWIDGRLKLSA
jgi:hypothetical protein